MKVLLGIAFLGFLMISENASAQQIRVNYDNISHAVLIPPSDPQYTHLRDRVLEASGTNEAIRNFQHIGVVLQSKSPEPILGYAVKWEVASAEGKISRFNLIWWQRLALAVLSRESSLANLARVKAALMVQVVSPDGYRFISPFFNVSRDSDAKNFGTNIFSGPAQFPSEVLKAASIKVTLDSVVYGDGLCEGEDTLNLCDSINGQMEGISSLAAMVRQEEAGGVTQQHILDHLLAGPTRIVRRGPSRKASQEEWAKYAQENLLAEISRVRHQQGDREAISKIYQAETSFRVHR